MGSCRPDRRGSPGIEPTLLASARDEAIEHMERDAVGTAAAALNVRMETSELSQGASEVIAYGTAVRLDRT